MIWHSGFAGPILGRGRNCFQDGALVGLFRGPEEWQALVVGTKLYRVGAGIHRGEVSSLRCNCPYAREDQRCKHMAALFYALENRGQDVMKDDDAALSARLDALSSDEARELLLLAIDANSTRCTALLLNRRRKDEEAAFSPDEFTLDDLPEDALAGGRQDKQGDNDPMKLLFPEKGRATSMHAGER